MIRYGSFLYSWIQRWLKHCIDHMVTLGPFISLLGLSYYPNLNTIWVGSIRFSPFASRIPRILLQSYPNSFICVCWLGFSSILPRHSSFRNPSCQHTWSFVFAVQTQVIFWFCFDFPALSWSEINPFCHRLLPFGSPRYCPLCRLPITMGTSYLS